MLSETCAHTSWERTFNKTLQRRKIDSYVQNLLTRVCCSRIKDALFYLHLSPDDTRESVFLCAMRMQKLNKIIYKCKQGHWSYLHHKPLMRTSSKTHSSCVLKDVWSPRAPLREFYLNKAWYEPRLSFGKWDKHGGLPHNQNKSVSWTKAKG